MVYGKKSVYKVSLQEYVPQHDNASHMGAVCLAAIPRLEHFVTIPAACLPVPDTV